MAWAVGQDVGNPLRKLVLMILADEHREDTDLCFPGLERIATTGEMSTKSAARHIDALAELGLITIYKRGRAHGYTLHCPPKADSLSDKAPAPDPATPDSVSTKADSLSATPDSVSKTPDRESTEPGRTNSNRERTGEGARKRARHPLPDSWLPSDEGISLANDLGMTNDDLQSAIERFRNHYLSTGDRRVDWSPVFANWIKRDARDGRRSRDANGSGAGTTGSGAGGKTSQRDRLRSVGAGLLRSVAERELSPAAGDMRTMGAEHVPRPALPDRRSGG